METKSKQQILKRRKEIEQELVDMLKEINPHSHKATERAGSDFGLEDIKKIIYKEDGQDCLTDIIAMFDRGGDASELSNVLELVTDAWNYFPHKVLGGISPAEVILKHQSQSALFECPECHLKYREKEWAEKCEAWCCEHKSCNLEITAHAEK